MLRKLLLSLSFLLIAISSIAAIKMPKIFSDNMVLQRSSKVKIWGWSQPHANIDVIFDGQKVSTTASSDGEWALFLQPMDADKNPKSMKIFENGKVDAELKNILVGEVWLLAGQSNMEFHLIQSSNGKEVVKNANYPAIRYFSTNNQAASPILEKDMPENSKWVECSPKTAGTFHAVGFYFGEALMKDLDVPVGLVGVALGATHVACWIPKEDFEGHKGLEIEWNDHLNRLKDYDYKKALAAYEKRMEDYDVAMKKNKLEGAPKPKKMNWRDRIKPLTFSALLPHFYPTGNYNSKIAPIVGLSLRGVLWYQGEGDALPALSPYYYDSLTQMINVWRKNWKNPKLPFLIVQIASFSSPKEWNWNDIQAAQTQVWRNMKNVYMTTTLDIGEERDIHPRDKSTLGNRLEKIALAELYSKLPSGSANPPFFKSAEFRNNTALLKIESFSRKLDISEPLRGFETLSNGKWNEARAEISKSDKSSVVVHSSDSSKIDGVRYLWKSWNKPDIAIQTEDGQSASPALFMKN